MQSILTNKSLTGETTNIDNAMSFGEKNTYIFLDQLIDSEIKLVWIATTDRFERKIFKSDALFENLQQQGTSHIT